MFTKQHFELVARTVRAARHCRDKEAALAWIVNELAVEFARVNPRFDRGRFEQACSAEGLARPHRERA